MMINVRLAVILAGIAVGLVILAGIAVGLAGCNSSTHVTAAVRKTEGQPLDTLDTVSDAFHKASDVDSYRTAIQQLNTYLSKNPKYRPQPLSDQDRQMLSSQFSLDANEMAEVTSDTFTALDAQYLEFRVLLRDAAQALRIDKEPPQQRASIGFDWLMRQIALRERQGPSLPPEFVLRRGWGTANERAFTFLGFLEELGLHGCAVMIPGADSRGGPQLWTVGALVDKDIYLFDPRLGFAIPGPGHKGVATLAQVRAEPSILKSLTVNEQLPYDVSGEQVKRAEVYVATSLSALAPRMQSLQSFFSGANAFVLSVNGPDLLRKFQNAAHGTTEVHVWNQAGNPDTPFRLLRNFLPPNEGGVDQTGWRERVMSELVPQQALPPLVVALPGPQRQRFQELFSFPFIYVRLQPNMPREMLTLWLPGLTEGRPDVQGQRQVAEIALRGHMPRDLVLRGRYTEASEFLGKAREELTRQSDSLRSNRGEIDKAAQEWAKFAVREYLKAARSGDAARSKSAETVAMPEASMELLQKNEGPMLAMVRGSAAGPMLVDVLYLLALCKHEQAERAQAKLEQSQKAGKQVSTAESEDVRSAWKVAANWWKTYLEHDAAAPNTPSVRRYRARALQFLGQSAEAAAVLRDLSGPFAPLEKTAHLYLAREAEAK
jgi:hypothetical protein